MKKLTLMLFVACMVLMTTSCTSNTKTNNHESQEKTPHKQTAQAYLDQEKEKAINITIDLSGGWSVEFSRGAAYIYKGSVSESEESDAMLITLDPVVYSEYEAQAMADEGHKEADGGIYFQRDGHVGAYITSLSDTAYVLVTTKNEADIETVVSRLTMSLE